MKQYVSSIIFVSYLLPRTKEDIICGKQPLTLLHSKRFDFLVTIILNRSDARGREGEREGEAIPGKCGFSENMMMATEESSSSAAAAAASRARSSDDEERTRRGGDERRRG